MKKSQLCHTRNHAEESIYYELREFLQLSVLISQQDLTCKQITA